MFWSALLLVRFLLAALFVTVAPGLALLFALFPRAQFEPAERAFIIMSTSVALSSLTAVALVWTPAGLEAWSFALVLLMITVALAATGVVRYGGRMAYRSTLNEAKRSIVALPRRLITPPHTIELPLFLVVLVMLIGAALLRGESSTRVTEFYFPPEQLAALTTQAQQAQASLDVPFEIANGAAQPQTFRVEVWANGTKVTEHANIVVAAQATTMMTITVPAATSAESHPLDFRLYNATQSEPVAQLRLLRGPLVTDKAARQ